MSNVYKLSGTLVYVCLNKPVPAYDKDKPKEWKAGVVITDEDVVDAYEEYASSINAKVSVKKIKSSEFEAKFKCDLPEGAGKNVWVITVRKSTEQGKTGKPIPEAFTPRVLEKQGKAMIDVTTTKLPANGSKGVISIEPFIRNNGTASLYLKNVLVTDMIEYEGNTDEYNIGSEFDDEVDTEESPVTKSETSTSEKPKSTRVRGKPAQASKEEVDEDPPF